MTNFTGKKTLKINIPNVTGDIVINAMAVVEGTAASDMLQYLTYGKGIGMTSNQITDNPECWASVNTIPVEKGQKYNVKCDATWLWVCSFDSADRFKTKLVNGSDNNPQNFIFTADTDRIRLGCYDPRRELTYFTMKKVVETTYTISSNLSNSTCSNAASTVNEGESYTATINPKTNHKLTSLTVTMGGVNITSSVVNGNTINIPSVTGNIVITATAVENPTGGGNTGSGTIGGMTYGKGISQSTHTITDNPECWATINPITVEQGGRYTITMDATWAWVHSFNEDGSYKAQLVQGNANNPQTYSFVADSTKIRYGCYDPNKRLTYCNLTKEGSSGGGNNGNTGGGGTVPSPGGNLSGTYLFFGDSICYGGGTSGYGYPQAIKAVEPGITALNYGVSGTCIAKNTTYDVNYPSILSKIQKTAIYADYVVLEGGFNDAWASRNPLGTFKGGTAPTDSSAIVAYSNTLNEYQFADALEKCICEIKLKWWGKKIFYVIPHRMHENYNKPYFDLAKQICNKWGVIVIDLRSGGVAPTTDGTHPTRAGYDQYYAPPIINVLKANK